MQARRYEKKDSSVSEYAVDFPYIYIKFKNGRTYRYHANIIGIDTFKQLENALTNNEGANRIINQIRKTEKKLGITLAEPLTSDPFSIMPIQNTEQNQNETDQNHS